MRGSGYALLSHNVLSIMCSASALENEQLTMPRQPILGSHEKNYLQLAVCAGGVPAYLLE